MVFKSLKRPHGSWRFDSLLRGRGAISLSNRKGSFAKRPFGIEEQLRCGLGLRSEIAGADIWVGLDALASPVTTLSSSSSLSAPAVICPAG